MGTDVLAQTSACTLMPVLTGLVREDSAVWYHLRRYPSENQGYFNVFSHSGNSNHYTQTDKYNVNTQYIHGQWFVLIFMQERTMSNLLF